MKKGTDWNNIRSVEATIVRLALGELDWLVWRILGFAMKKPWPLRDLIFNCKIFFLPTQTRTVNTVNHIHNVCMYVRERVRSSACSRWFLTCGEMWCFDDVDNCWRKKLWPCGMVASDWVLSLLAFEITTGHLSCSWAFTFVLLRMASWTLLLSKRLLSMQLSS